MAMGRHHSGFNFASRAVQDVLQRHEAALAPGPKRDWEEADSGKMVCGLINRKPPVDPDVRVF